MDGLLLQLLDDKRGSPGRSFWPCFGPVRPIFDRHFWIFSNQPWMGSPEAFDEELELADYEGVGETSVSLWRPGSIGRWAGHFFEEFVELWSVPPADDAPRLASEFRRTFFGQEDAFIEKHAAIWLIYTDSTCWEIFAREASLLRMVRDHLEGDASIRVFDTTSEERDRALREGAGPGG